MALNTTNSARCAGGVGRAYAFAIVAGMILWFAASFASGKRETWDDSSYWMIVYPVAIGISAVLGYCFPMRSWRWPLTLFLGQFVAMTIRNGEIGNLWPLGMIMFAVLAVPGIAVATLASSNRMRSGSNRRL